MSRVKWQGMQWNILSFHAQCIFPIAYNWFLLHCKHSHKNDQVKDPTVKNTMEVCDRSRTYVPKLICHQHTIPGAPFSPLLCEMPFSKQLLRPSTTPGRQAGYHHLLWFPPLTSTGSEGGIPVSWDCTRAEGFCEQTCTKTDFISVQCFCVPSRVCLNTHKYAYIIRYKCLPLFPAFTSPEASFKGAKL